MDLKDLYFHDGRLVSILVEGGKSPMATVVLELYDDEIHARQREIVEFHITGLRSVALVGDLEEMRSHVRSGEISDGLARASTRGAILKVFSTAGSLVVEGKLLRVQKRNRKEFEDI